MMRKLLGNSSSMRYSSVRLLSADATTNSQQEEKSGMKDDGVRLSERAEERIAELRKSASPFVVYYTMTWDVPYYPYVLLWLLL